MHTFLFPHDTTELENCPQNYIIAKSSGKDEIFAIHTEQPIALSGIFSESYRVTHICRVGEKEKKQEQQGRVTAKRPQ